MVLTDCFFQAGATGSGNEVVDRIHPYVEGARVSFDVRAASWSASPSLSELRASTSDEDVFEVTKVEVAPGFLWSEDTLTVEIQTRRSGEAALVFADASGVEVDRKNLRVVVPDAVRFEIPVSLPSIKDPDMDTSALRVGSMGADLLVSYESNGERADGLGVVSLGVSAGATVRSTTLSVPSGPTPLWDVLHLDGVGEAYSVQLLVGGAQLGVVQVIPALETDVATLEFIRRQSLAEFLAAADIEVPDDVLEAVTNSNDANILCGKDDRCVAKIEPRDDAARAILGAPIVWDVGEDLPAETGDLVIYRRAFGASATITATVNGISRTLTVEAEPESLTIASSTEAHCGQSGADTAAMAAGGLMLLLAHRRAWRKLA